MWKQLYKIGMEAYYDIKAYPTCWLHHIAGATPFVRAWGVNPKCLRPEQAKQRAVIFLHGCGANQGCWLPVIRRLRRSQLGPFFSFNYSGVDQGLERLQLKLKEIQALYKIHGVEKIEVDLVGHSLGAITSASYSLLNQHMLPFGVQLRRVVSIAGRLRIRGKSWEPLYRSVASLVNQIDLAYSKNPDALDLCVIGGSSDRMVPLASICVQNDPLRSLVSENRGHLSVLYCPKALDQLRDWLLY